MFVHPQHLAFLSSIPWKTISEIATGVSGALGAAYTIYKWAKTNLTNFVQAPMIDMNAKLEKVMVNHLPHIEAAVLEQGKKIDSLSTDVQIMGSEVKLTNQRVDDARAAVEDTKAAVRTLGQSFIKHLENASERK